MLKGKTVAGEGEDFWGFIFVFTLRSFETPQTYYFKVWALLPLRISRVDPKTSISAFPKQSPVRSLFFTRVHFQNAITFEGGAGPPKIV